MHPNTRHRGTYLVIITRFHWPTTQDINKVVEDEESEDAKTWIEGTRQLIMAHGHKNSVIARTRETPSEAILFTTWEDTSSFEAFEASSSYPIYLAALSIHRPVSTRQTVEFNSRQDIPDGLQAFQYISIRTIYFASSLSDEQKTAAFQVPGFSKWRAGTASSGFVRSLVADVWRSWIEEEVEFNGQKAAAMIVVHWWNGWELRNSYLEWREPEWELEMYNLDGTVVMQNTIGMTRGEIWDMRLSEKGALGWKDETCEVLVFPAES